LFKAHPLNLVDHADVKTPRKNIVEKTIKTFIKVKEIG
jgi:hypothetical protein